VFADEFPTLSIILTENAKFVKQKIYLPELASGDLRCHAPDRAILTKVLLASAGSGFDLKNESPSLMLIMNQGANLVSFELIPSPEEIELDQKG